MHITSNLLGIISDVGKGRFAVFVVLLSVLFLAFIFTLVYALYISKKVNEEDRKKTQPVYVKKDAEKIAKPKLKAKIVKKKTVVKKTQPKIKKPKIKKPKIEKPKVRAKVRVKKKKVK